LPLRELYAKKSINTVPTSLRKLQGMDVYIACHRAMR